MGQKRMYDFLDGNPGVESRPVDYVNDPQIIAQNDRVISVNATLQVDLTGACNAEHLLGHQYSASGGQLDFVRGAYCVQGGQVDHRLPRDRGGRARSAASCRALDGPVTTPRIDTQIIVTEHGWTDLKGRSSTERANALIEDRATRVPRRPAPGGPRDAPGLEARIARFGLPKVHNANCAGRVEPRRRP